jgi:hypothetical protein
LYKDGNSTEEEQSKKVVEALHKILRPFLLRRFKSDVEKSLLPSESHAGISVVNDEGDSCRWVEKENNIYVGLTQCWRRTLMLSMVCDQSIVLDVLLIPFQG